MGSRPAGQQTAQPFYSLLVCVCVCVCMFLCTCVTDTERRKENSSFELSTFASLTPGKANFSGCFSCSSFNWFTLLISSSLMMNGGGCYPLCLSFFSPTVIQAVRPRGCQRGNKVTGWWARHPLSDHMDWCCARHHSHWLTQQGSSHKRVTYSRPGVVILFLPHFPISVYFDLSNLLVPLCSPICPSLFTVFLAFANTCLLFLPALFKCYGGESCMPAVIPLFL